MELIVVVKPGPAPKLKLPLNENETGAPPSTSVSVPTKVPPNKEIVVFACPDLAKGTTIPAAFLMVPSQATTDQIIVAAAAGAGPKVLGEVIGLPNG